MTPIEFLKVENGGRYAAIFFHGYGASQEDLYPLHQELPWKNCDFYFPNAPNQTNFGGRAWFDVQMEEVQRLMMQGKFRDFKTASPPHFNLLLDHVVSWIKRDLLTKYDGLLLGGFSQGAMMASHLIPMLMDAGNILGGIFYSGQLIDEKLFSANTAKVQTTKRPFIFASHGRLDPILKMSGGRELFDAYQSWGCSGKWSEFDGQHTITSKIVSESYEIFSPALV